MCMAKIFGICGNSKSKKEVYGVDTIDAMMPIGYDYTNQVKIKTYNTPSNKYTVPENGIILVSSMSQLGTSVEVRQPGKATMTLLDVCARTYDNTTYESYAWCNVYAGQEVYFGNDTPEHAYFVPFLYKA